MEAPSLTWVTLLTESCLSWARTSGFDLSDASVTTDPNLKVDYSRRKETEEANRTQERPTGGSQILPGRSREHQGT